MTPALRVNDLAVNDLAMNDLAMNDLAVNDLGALDASRGVAGVDYQLCFLNDLFVVVIGVVGHDEHTIVLA